MTEARMIDANELEIELTKQKAHLMDKACHTTTESDRMMYTNTATGLLHAINILHNAPTVEQKESEQILQPIKVNIPEDIKDKLIEEMSKPRKVILDESKTVQDCIIAYNDGFETARWLFEIPHGEWIKRNDDCFDWFECSVCGYGSDGEITRATPFCPICGADMRKGESE